MLLKLLVASILGLGLVLPGTVVQKHGAPVAATSVAKTASLADGCCGCGDDACDCATCPICSSGKCCANGGCGKCCQSSNVTSSHSAQKCHAGMTCCQADHAKK
jgi:hypothetical protein